MHKITINRRARFDYQLGERFEAGLVLAGHEIKLIRRQAVNIQDAFAVFRNGELFLINMQLGDRTSQPTPANLSPRYPKLLLHQRQLQRLQQQLTHKRLVIIPLRLYLKSQRAKIEIALACPRRKYDKRQLLKTREADRNMEWKEKNWQNFK